jgi:RNA polymerase sigma factor (sigma-70 family)
VIFTVDMGFLTMTPPSADNFAARIFLGPALRTQSDRRLVDLVRDGYDAAFEEIVRRYRRPLDRFAAAIVGSGSEDVTQDAFSKALLALRGSEAEIELRPWLYRIVRNTALNDLRDRAPAAEELSEVIPGARSAAAEAEAHEELADLMERLRALPEPQRAALVMRELEGLSHEEIAAALGMSGGAARQAIYRARTTLRDGLGLLVPLPLLRMLADNGGEAIAAGGALAAGAGTSTAGGAALGGLSGGAAKVGVAVLIAGSVGAGVAVEQRGGDGQAPAAAQAAQSPGGAREHSVSVGSGSSGPGGGASDDSSGRGGGDSSGPGPGGDDSERSGTSGGDNSGPSRSSGESDDDFEFDEDDNSGPGNGELEIEPVEEPEAEIESIEEPEIDDNSGSGSRSSGSGSGGDLDDD